MSRSLKTKKIQETVTGQRRETKQTGGLTAMWYPGLDPRTEKKDISGKTKEIHIRSSLC